ncbi:unnamed protein product [Coregonus sp. 'balchen']|nr:unnamed protein product [Coregonus sp. 'balchen']
MSLEELQNALSSVIGPDSQSGWMERVFNELAGDPAEEGVNRRRFRGWTTDSVYMLSVHNFAVATSSKDLHFVDVSTASCFEDVHLFELSVWDISSHCCLRTVHLQFPCLQPGRAPEHGNFPFLLVALPYLSQTLPHILVCCRDYLARLRLEEGGSNREEERGDNAMVPLSPVWNLLNGLNLHKLEHVTFSEVTGVICLHDNQLLAVGWSQQVTQDDITGAKHVYMRADMLWESGQQHRADILAVDHCPALGVVATGSHDGEVIIWTQDTQRPLVRLQRDTHSLPPPAALLSCSPGGPTSVEVLVYVERLFFLSGSVDGTARLWTWEGGEGGHVGSFGQ